MGFVFYNKLDNLTFVKVEKNHFTIKGEFEYLKHCEKSVVVDGERYVKEWNEYAKMNVEDIDKRYFTTYEINFDFIGTKYMFTDTDYFSQSLMYLYSRYRHPIGSTNNDVARVQLLWNEGVIDKRVLDIYVSKNELYSNQILTMIKKNMSLPVLICAYGFNNYMYAEIHLKDFLEIENKITTLRHYSKYKEAFNYLGIDIEKGLTLENSYKLLLTKTK